MKVGEPILPRPAKDPCPLFSGYLLAVVLKSPLPQSIADLATGRGKIMPLKIEKDAVRARGGLLVIDPLGMRPFVFYPVTLSGESLLIYKTYEGKIIIYEDSEPPRSAK